MIPKLPSIALLIKLLNLLLILPRNSQPNLFTILTTTKSPLTLTIAITPEKQSVTTVDIKNILLETVESEEKIIEEAQMITNPPDLMIATSLGIIIPIIDPILATETDPETEIIITLPTLTIDPEAEVNLVTDTDLATDPPTMTTTIDLEADPLLHTFAMYIQ